LSNAATTQELRRLFKAEQDRPGHKGITTLDAVSMDVRRDKRGIVLLRLWYEPDVGLAFELTRGAIKKLKRDFEIEQSLVSLDRQNGDWNSQETKWKMGGI
jgi:hypothetical protein